MLGFTVAPVKPKPLEKVTPITPQEALRLGRLYYPLFTSSVFVDHITKGRFIFKKTQIALCPVAAIAVGYGWDAKSWDNPHINLDPHLSPVQIASIIAGVDALGWKDREVIEYLNGTRSLYNSIAQSA